MEAEVRAGAVLEPDDAFASGLGGNLSLTDGRGFSDPAGFLGTFSLRFDVCEALALVARGTGFGKPLDTEPCLIIGAVPASAHAAAVVVGSASADSASILTIVVIYSCLGSAIASCASIKSLR